MTFSKAKDHRADSPKCSEDRLYPFVVPPHSGMVGSLEDQATDSVVANGESWKARALATKSDKSSELIDILIYTVLIEGYANVSKPLSQKHCTLLSVQCGVKEICSKPGPRFNHLCEYKTGKGTYHSYRCYCIFLSDLSYYQIVNLHRWE
ncbi:uncharacterized protein BO96DRAFT_437164 [Aspergillus niger CBS 101883]|uniref:Uncharacterized protein n=2 Tax=Aspergillus niger TaxID=5061 RepID=A2R0P2_ASPNC|nr:uncharacterized protein BO96DRAFT_437164 [Aspergillus niger CBS 101883]XP_059601964.1 hypothetical protein An12g09290 [Aspergillus niger]PYH53201.1 hypothetical protein BO96DRAFT_437164 [Aspergillus niger CBS 101883]CAK41359.1 hypothetical protein An12g09290 [Aspergillus niger]